MPYSADNHTFGDDLPFLPELNEHERLQLQWDTANEAGIPISFSDPLRDAGKGPQMMVIPAGTFEMGSPASEFGHSPLEGPQHYRQIPHAFAFSRHAVTAAQFARFEQDTGWRWRTDLLTAKGEFPLMNIRIHDAERYCDWLSEQTGQRYRIPSEAEWEYACRAGTTTAFHFGDTVSCREVHFNASLPYEEARQKRRWYLPQCSPLTQALPVGSKPPNIWGLHEMHGNVWEFTSSAWRDSHTGDAEIIVGGGRRRQAMVVKGGSWFDAAVFSRSAARRPRLRDELDVNLGLRLLREL